MQTTYYTNDGPVELEAEIGAGGEGDVFAIRDGKGHCAKIRNKPVQGEQLEKLNTMLAFPPRDLCYEQMGHHSVAWPEKLLFQDIRLARCRGFVMPEVDRNRFKDAGNFASYDVRRREQQPQAITWRHLYNAACNLASTVAAIHGRGHCIGDLKRDNVKMDNAGLICLVDCDSFQIRNPETGKTYRCPVGTDEYMAPEILGRNCPDFDRTTETDSFALGVLLFQLLMEGFSPYACAVRGTDRSEENDPRHLIKRGLFPYGLKSGTVGPPVPAPPFEILPAQIRDLFRRCFVEGHKEPGARPSASEWFRALEAHRSDFVRCEQNENHLYLDHLRACPWCEIRRQREEEHFPAPIHGYQLSLEEAKRLPSPEERQRALISHISMALADGVLTTQEKDRISQIGDELRIPPKDVERILDSELKRHRARALSDSDETPRLEISQTNFAFRNLHTGSTAVGEFVVSNTGRGTLSGPIHSNRGWLKPLEDQIDTNRQTIRFVVDATGLPLGLTERGEIEIQSNGGTQTVVVELSVEVPDVAMARFRKELFWLGFCGGGLFGYLLYQLLPRGPSRGETAGLAGLIGILAAIIVGARCAGFGGGFGGFLLGVAVLGTLQNVWPEAFSTLTWAIIYGTLLHTTARVLFVAKQTRNSSAVLAVALGAVLLPAAVVITGTSVAQNAGLHKVGQQTVGQQTVAQPATFTSLNPTVTALRFFESGLGETAKEHRNYTTLFDKSSTRYVNWELDLSEPSPASRVNFYIKAVWNGPDGTIVTRSSTKSYILPGWTNSYHSSGWGCAHPPCQAWKPGLYNVVLSIQGIQVATGSFQIAIQ
jgi:serine/threonine protein kinase